MGRKAASYAMVVTSQNSAKNSQVLMKGRRKLIEEVYAFDVSTRATEWQCAIESVATAKKITILLFAINQAFGIHQDLMTWQ
jgi:hypothetical protein